MTTVITDAYSPTNVGDGELVRLTVDVARTIAPERPLVVLATDPDGFRRWPDLYTGAQFEYKPLSRVRWKALGRLDRAVWLAREAGAMALAIGVSALPMPREVRRRLTSTIGMLFAVPSLRALAGADDVIGVAGGYLGSRYLRESMMTLAQFRIAQRLGARVQTMPLSVASTNRALRIGLRRFGADVLWRCRDHHSQRLLAEVGIEADVVPDLAWLDATDALPPAQRSGLVVAPVGSAFYGAGDDGPPACWPAVETALAWLPEGEAVHLVAMHFWDPRLQDGRDDHSCLLLEQLIEAHAPEREVTVHEVRTYDEVRQLMGTARVAICQRLHAALGALTTGTPAQVVAYEPKHQGVLDVAGIGELTALDASAVVARYSPEAVRDIGLGQRNKTWSHVTGSRASEGDSVGVS